MVVDQNVICYRFYRFWQIILKTFLVRLICVMFILMSPVRWLLQSCVGPCVCKWNEAKLSHYIDVIMTPIASQITSLTVVYSIVYSGADQRKHQTRRHWPLCGEITGTAEFPAQRASNPENVSICWRHHETSLRLYFMEFKSSMSGTLMNMRNYYFMLLLDDCDNTYLRRKLVITYLGTCKNDLNVHPCVQWRTKLLLDDACNDVFGSTPAWALGSTHCMICI